MGFIENIKRHQSLVEEDRFEELGDVLIYTNEAKGEYLAGKLYRRPAGDYTLISDDFDIACLMKELRIMKDDIEEVWFKLLGKGWYFKKEDRIYVGRHVR